MGYMFWGLGLSLIVALGTLILNSNVFARPLEYKYRDDEEGTERPEREAGPSHQRANNDECICTICLTEIEPFQKEYLPCFHYYHSDCLRSLIRHNSRQCPICRTQF